MWAYVYDAGRLVIAATLLVAGASKLANPRPMASGLAEVFGLGRVPGNGLARTTAAAELAAAFLVASGWSVRFGLALTGLIGAGIAVFVVTAMVRGVKAPCGCFGESSGRLIGRRNLLAGLALLGGAALLLVLPATSEAFMTSEAVMLPLTAVTALLAVMERDRARLLSPFRRHFQPAPSVPIPPHRRSPRG